MNDFPLNFNEITPPSGAPRGYSESGLEIHPARPLQPLHQVQAPQLGWKPYTIIRALQTNQHENHGNGATFGFTTLLVSLNNLIFKSVLILRT